MNLKICDICKKDPRISEGQCSDTIKTVVINSREIDLCDNCAERPFSEVATFAKRSGRSVVQQSLDQFKQTLSLPPRVPLGWPPPELEKRGAVTPTYGAATCANILDG